jgi:hypothetical protein
MEEIVRVAAEKTGMSVDQVRPVVAIVIGELKQRLPAPVAAQVDGLLASPAAAGAIEQAADLLGGLFTKKD